MDGATCKALADFGIWAVEAATAGRAWAWLLLLSTLSGVLESAAAVAGAAALSVFEEVTVLASLTFSSSLKSPKRTSLMAAASLSAAAVADFEVVSVAAGFAVFTSSSSQADEELLRNLICSASPLVSAAEDFAEGCMNCSTISWVLTCLPGAAAAAAEAAAVAVLSLSD